MAGSNIGKWGRSSGHSWTVALAALCRQSHGVSALVIPMSSSSWAFHFLHVRIYGPAALTSWLVDSFSSSTIWAFSCLYARPMDRSCSMPLPKMPTSDRHLGSPSHFLMNNHAIRLVLADTQSPGISIGRGTEKVWLVIQNEGKIPDISKSVELCNWLTQTLTHEPVHMDPFNNCKHGSGAARLHKYIIFISLYKVFGGELTLCSGLRCVWGKWEITAQLRRTCRTASLSSPPPPLAGTCSTSRCSWWKRCWHICTEHRRGGSITSNSYWGSRFKPENEQKKPLTLHRQFSGRVSNVRKGQQRQLKSTEGESCLSVLFPWTPRPKNWTELHLGAMETWPEVRECEAGAAIHQIEGHTKQTDKRSGKLLRSLVTMAT